MACRRPGYAHHHLLCGAAGRSTLRQVCETYFHLQPLFVEPGIKTGMPVLVDNPTELGADRLVDCIAAYRALWRPLHRSGFRHRDHV